MLTRLVEVRSTLVQGRRYPWQPCEGPSPGTITLNCSNQYLPIPKTNREGGLRKKKKNTKMASKQESYSKDTVKNCKELTVYTSHKMPLLEASGHPQHSSKNC